MGQDDEATSQDALQDSDFLSWRKSSGHQGKPKTQCGCAGLGILDRHQDLVGDEADSSTKNGPGARASVKPIPGSGLPGFVYSRLLTTRAGFLCRRPDRRS